MISCPEKPEKLLGTPLGQYHCPYCGMMVVAGVPHPALVEWRTPTTEEQVYLGLEEPGYYGFLPDFSFVGPYPQEDEAEQAWRQEMKSRFGVDW